MRKTKTPRLWWAFCIFILSAHFVLAQSGLPMPPPNAFLNGYWFGDTNWVADDAPNAYTNVLIDSPWGMLIDRTNLAPSFVNLPVIQDGSTNIDLEAGGIWMVFIPSWATDDTNQMGTGPADRG